MALLGSLVGCSDSSYSRVLNDDLPEGFYLSGEFLEFKPRDPSAPDPEWIDPCNEIPEEVLEDIGMKRGERSGGTYFGLVGCSASVDENLKHDPDLVGRDYGLVINGGPPFNSEYVERGMRIEDRKLEGIDGAIFNSMPGNGCFISADTPRGIFIVSVRHHSEERPISEHCDMAEKAFYKIYNSLREGK
ncbi:hypothetical protein [Corynebacterium uterequi]|uniref:hypothetical protein n=1 Tax=Corynebacterium uterequi TaxID=1072256 RepID=UPI00130D5963|nr:hypothetical protein [Corynebacterium uterequi]